MPTYLLRRFTAPTTLRAIAPDRLLTFLRPYERFFRGRGLVLPGPDCPEALDHEQLIAILLTPDGDTPVQLIDALECVDDLALPDQVERLLQAARQRGLHLDEEDEQSPADLAVRLWLADPDLLERQQAEQYLGRPRSYESYQAWRLPAPVLAEPRPAQLRDLERALGAWFEQRHHGHQVRVFCYPRPDGVWFLVRHGEPYRREESLQGEATGTVCYRPAKNDVLTYHAATGELRVHAETPGEKQLYRTQFGRVLFGHPEFFPGTGKYTLAPLQEQGAAALVCGDVPGLEWVRLRELHFFWGGAANELEIRKADDVFAALAARGERLPQRARLVRAVFRLKFAYAKAPRSVTVRPSNLAQFQRDGDAPVVEDWLRRRGFILGQAGAPA